MYLPTNQIPVLNYLHSFIQSNQSKNIHINCGYATIRTNRNGKAPIPSVYSKYLLFFFSFIRLLYRIHIPKAHVNAAPRFLPGYQKAPAIYIAINRLPSNSALRQFQKTVSPPAVTTMSPILFRCYSATLDQTDFPPRTLPQ